MNNVSNMSYFRIQLVRSRIGLPKKTVNTINALGFTKRNSIVYHPVNESFAGAILKIKELVKVDVVDEKLTKPEMRELRKSDPGFEVEKQA